MAERNARARLAELQASQSRPTGSDSSSDDATLAGGNEGMVARMGALLRGQAEPKAAKPEPEASDEAPEADQGEELEVEARDQAEPEEGGEPDDQAEELEGGEAPITVDDAAKKLGMSRAEFNALAVQVGDQRLTLGELKAKLPELMKLDKDRESLDDARGTWELERVASYRNINAIIDQLPRNVLTANLLRELQTHHEETRNREMQNLHFARPNWAKPEYAQAARTKMAALAKEYGFGRVEVDGVMDHRQLLLLQDYADLRERIKASRDNARKLSEPSQQRRGEPGAVQGRGDTSSTPRKAKPTREDRARILGGILNRR
jgi:hypothetical protein